MTREEFLDKLDALLKEYCYCNKDYQNIHEAREISWVGLDKMKYGVKILIDTYLTAKEI